MELSISEAYAIMGSTLSPETSLAKFIGVASNGSETAIFND